MAKHVMCFQDVSNISNNDLVRVMSNRAVFLVAINHNRELAYSTTFLPYGLSSSEGQQGND